MIISRNGIEFDVTQTRDGSQVRITKQDKNATAVIKHFKNIVDEETGFSIRSNKFPSFKTKGLRLYVRGAEKTKDDNVVTIPHKAISFNSLTGALNRIAAQLVKPDYVKIEDANAFVKQNRVHPTLDGGVFHGGNTTLVRMAFINREMATKLRLTHHDKYPENCIEWEAIRPIITKNTHYNEHIGQGIDVLNRSIGVEKYTKYIVNPQNVDIDGARWTVNYLKKAFEEANKKGKYHLVALWRMITAFRGPDFDD